MFLATRSLAVTDVCTARSTLVQIISISSAFCVRDNAICHTSRSVRLSRQFSSSSSSHSSSRISYRVAGSCSAKGRRFIPEKHTYTFDPTIHEAIGVALDNIGEGRSQQKRPASGEDAFFASRVGAVDTGAVAFAVADGVGGWAEHKIDPADVSHGLCTYMAQHALTEEASQRKLRPKELLQKGYNSVVADENITAGGTTASVGVAQTDGNVELAKYVTILVATGMIPANELFAFPQPWRFGVCTLSTRCCPSVLRTANTCVQYPISTKHYTATNAGTGTHVWRRIF